MTDLRRMSRLKEALTVCPSCAKGPLLADEAGGELLCGNCGFVIRDKIAGTRPEWRGFSPIDHDDRSRVGMPASLSSHDMGLATVIASVNTDGQGKPLSGSMRETVRRMRVWDNRTQAHKSTDRNLRQAFGELERLSNHLSIPFPVVEKSAYIYRKAVDRGLVKGRSIIGIIAASLYAACRDMEVSRTLKDVASASNIEKKELAYYYRLLLTKLDISMPLPDPAKCISRISSRAGVSEKTKRDALGIMRKVSQAGYVAGKNPMGLAAAALYVACVLQGESKSQAYIAEAAEVTQVTVRSRYKGIRLILGIQPQTRNNR